MSAMEAKLSIKDRFWNFLYNGLPENHDLEILRKVLTLNIIIIIGTTFTAILGTVAFIQNNVMLGIADFFIFFFLLFILFDLHKSKKYNRCALLGTTVMGLFFAYLIISGGVSNTAYLWLFTYPSIAIFLLGGRTGSSVSAVFIFLIAVVMLFRIPLGIPAHYSNTLLIRFFAVYISIHFIGFAMERMRRVVQIKLENTNQELDKLNQENLKLIRELKQTIEEVETLQGIIPICAQCKKIRNDSGYWEQVEEYVHNHSKAQFTHGLCPECKTELYAELDLEDKKTKKSS